MTDTVPRNELRVNAWTGMATPTSTDAWNGFASNDRWLGGQTVLAPPVPADFRDWRDERVGWGLLVPDRDDLTPKDKAAGDDLPEPLRTLVAARGQAPILRWRPELGHTQLRRYSEDGSWADLSIQATPPGTGPQQIPKYLLIAADPTYIPWSLQFVLNTTHYVGRLALDEAGFEHYVAALLADFAQDPPNPRAPVLWSVDHGRPDITWLMARGLGAKLQTDFASDPDFKTGQRWLVDDQATVQGLVGALSQTRPALVATTSHGMTGPLGDPAATRANLGGLIDDARAVLAPDALGAWDPYGAVWYAHACCSAGSTATSQYSALFSAGDPIGDMLKAVSAAAGAMVSPLPAALLGASRPLGAFVGHVEPTFDWTLRDPVTGQLLSSTLRTCLYHQLFQQDRRTPIGFALGAHFREAGLFHAAWRATDTDVKDGLLAAKDRRLYEQLVAMDRQSLVILGDPTVSPPLLTAS